MQRQSYRSLEHLAADDPVGQPLASMQLEALSAADDPAWDQATGVLPGPGHEPLAPALHGATLAPDARAVRKLVDRLTDTLSSAQGIRALDVPRDRPEETDLALLEASIEWDAERLADIAEETGAEPAVVVTLGQCAALPLLLACGRRLMSGDSELVWELGYCPVCGSWPGLAEERGLNRDLWLRCNRCSAAWRSRHQRCIFCDNTDHEQLGYMAPEAERESRRVVTCDACQGYLKVFATVSPLSLTDVLRLDLQSLELDIAVIDIGYARPERPGFTPEVELAPTESKTRRWWPWL